MKYPELLKVGGNVGGVNSFQALNISDLTGGVFSHDTLLQGNNLGKGLLSPGFEILLTIRKGCFLMQSLKLEAPNLLLSISLLGDPEINLLTSLLDPIIESMACPTLTKLNAGIYAQFSGSSYKPQPMSKL